MKSNNSRFMVSSGIMFALVLAMTIVGSCNKKRDAHKIDQKPTLLEFKVYTAKSKYSLHEPLRMILVFKNISENDYYIHRMLEFADISFKLSKGTKGKIIEKTVSIDYSLDPEDGYYLLKKSEKYTEEFRFSFLYAVSSPGDYYITAKYRNLRDGRGLDLLPFWKFWENQPAVWTGEIESNEILIRFVKR